MDVAAGCLGLPEKLVVMSVVCSLRHLKSDLDTCHESKAIMSPPRELVQVAQGASFLLHPDQFNQSSLPTPCRNPQRCSFWWHRVELMATRNSANPPTPVYLTEVWGVEQHQQHRVVIPSPNREYPSATRRKYSTIFLITRCNYSFLNGFLVKHNHRKR